MGEHRTFRLGWWRGHGRHRLHGVASRPLLSGRGRHREGARVTDSLVGLPGRTGGRVRALIIGCGNLLRGDDGVGPEVVRRLTARGLPDGVGCIDAATAGIDIALWMRSVPHVIVVDACCSGSAPGTLIELRGAELEHLPPPSGISLHALRWDHALAFARWRLAEEYPAEVTALLIEGERFEHGEPLSPAVEEAVERVCGRIRGEVIGVAAAATAHPTANAPAASPAPLADEGEAWPAPGWHAGPRVEAVMDGQLIPFMAGDAPGIVVRGKGGLRAYRSRCAHAGLSLDSASIDRGGGALVCRWHAYRFDIDTGGGLTAPHRCLEGWPLRVIDGLIWVRPPVTAGTGQDTEASAERG